MRRPGLRKLLALGVGVLPACAVGPDYVEPQPSTPDAWHMQLSRGLTEGEANLHTWWSGLGDPVLDNLIERAAAGNLDLREAVARIDEARARRGIARGEWFPSVDGVGTYQRNQVSQENRITAPPPGSGARTKNIYQLGFDSTWEIDLFGRIRRSVESADASLQASVEDYRDVLVSLFAEVATTYTELRTLQERIRVTIANIETQRGTLKLTIDRNRAGLVGMLDVRQGEQNLASTESFLPRLRQQQIEALNRLGVLLGEHPSALHPELTATAPIPTPPDEIVVGLPAELLRQRPDLRRAERELAAQTAEIGVATADLYPRFALLGTFAFDATNVANLMTGDARAFNVGPAFRWNIFDGGRIRSNIEVQGALAEQALTRYEQTLLVALEEVENALVSYTEEHHRADALQRSVLASQQAVQLVQTLYRTGLTDFQNVLDTERTQFLQEDELAASTGVVTQNLIEIYRALGGGWDPGPAAMQASTESSEK